MALTQTDLENIDAAIASGHRLVRVEGRWVEYRSIDELKAARAHIAAQLASATAGSAAGRYGAFRFRFTTSRGD